MLTFHQFRFPPLRIHVSILLRSQKLSIESTCWFGWGQHFVRISFSDSWVLACSTTFQWLSKNSNGSSKSSLASEPRVLLLSSLVFELLHPPVTKMRLSCRTWYISAFLVDIKLFEGFPSYRSPFDSVKPRNQPKIHSHVKYCSHSTHSQQKPQQELVLIVQPKILCKYFWFSFLISIFVLFDLE